jgi:Arylsulfotransferase (ASST)
MLRMQPRRVATLIACLALCPGAALAASGSLWLTAGSSASVPAVSVFPIAGGRVAAPSTQITFRGLPASQLGPIVVQGSSSGVHAGRVLADSDGMGGSFVPAQPFKPGELVTVKTGLNIVGGAAGSFSFTVATPGGPIRAAATMRAKRTKHDVSHFYSRPDLRPVRVEMTKRPSRAAPGGIFVAPQDGPIQYGPMIIGPYAGLVWFKSVPRGESATDFRAQRYRGKPVLTWWQGRVNGGIGTGDGEVYDASYRPVATVRGANGIRADLHEFQITPQNTALISAYYPVFWPVPGSKKPRLVLDSVAQEVDIATGLVLFQWDSLDHVGLSDSHLATPRVTGHPYDYFHINSIQQDTDGNWVISARDTWAVYKVSHQSGAVIWTLGGKHSSFKMGKGTGFAFQHDARVRDHDEITIFDDGGGPPVVHKQSRGLTLKLDTNRLTASLAGQDEHRPSLLAEFEGNVQRQTNGDDLVGWGQQPFVTEFNSRGRAVFDARFVDVNSSYRAYRFQWTGTPSTRPAVAARAKRGRTTVYASWNGATRVARWRVLAGGSSKSLKFVTSARKAAFETTVPLGRRERLVAVQALDSHGTVLGSSQTVKG